VPATFGRSSAQKRGIHEDYIDAEWLEISRKDVRQLIDRWF